MLKVDNEVSLFGKFRRYFNLFEQAPSPRVKIREFTASNPWTNVRDGTYLYVVLPPTRTQPMRLRLSLMPLEFLLESAISHEDLALIKEADGTAYIAAPLSAGLIRVLDEEISTIDLNSGHFKPGNGRRENEHAALEAARLAFANCKAPLTPDTTFSHFRDRNASPTSK